MLLTRGVLPLLAVGAPLGTRMCAPGGELASLKVTELKDMLRAKGFKVGGNKAELVARLSASGGPAAAAGAVAKAEPAPPAASAGTAAGLEGLVSVEHCKS